MESWGSFWLAQGVVRFIRGIGFSRVRPGGSWVQPGSLRSLGFALGVVGFALCVVEFIRGSCVHLVSRWVLLDSFRVVGFTRVSPGGRWVHSGCR